MKFKKITPYILVFFFSFFITPLAINSFIKRANHKAEESSKGFLPQTNLIPNGTYNGKFRFAGIVFAKVNFEIENKRVKTIHFSRIYHTPGTAYKNEIEDQIKLTQKLEVNAISGATRTSNFAKAAIKDAVKNTGQYK